MCDGYVVIASFWLIFGGMAIRGTRRFTEEEKEDVKKYRRRKKNRLYAQTSRLKKKNNLRASQREAALAVQQQQQHLAPNTGEEPTQIPADLFTTTPEHMAHLNSAAAVAASLAAQNEYAFMAPEPPSSPPP